ncbi:hypothetical protein J3R30DRAFT_3820284 [Lentinula aciculospora]|uniref:Uncharacterized protein n=1 Tax=Lentinula aciculospora TaxID=153920 RepID=A0A9W9AM74_9AGAR|nr:hypothetical protein J3R30DRAFT_3820284 [Lentinula aciculospora]
MAVLLSNIRLCKRLFFDAGSDQIQVGYFELVAERFALDSNAMSFFARECRKQWCLNQNLAICAGASLGDTDPDTATGKEGDVEARCFQRDSPRDQLVVTIFLLVVFGLLLGAGIKRRLEKAGLDVGSTWNNGVTWWEHLRSRMPVEELGLYRLRNRTGNDTRSRREEYVPVSNEPA